MVSNFGIGASLPTTHTLPHMPGGSQRGDRIAVSNRRARRDFDILESVECGIVLKGGEVKILRQGKGNLTDAFARIDQYELWLYGLHLPPWPFTQPPLDPVRTRKLLAHRSEIDRFADRLDREPLTLVPLDVHFKDGYAKVELALARGRKKWDKRQALAEKDAQRERDRALREARR